MGSLDGVVREAAAKIESLDETVRSLEDDMQTKLSEALANAAQVGNSSSALVTPCESSQSLDGALTDAAQEIGKSSGALNKLSRADIADDASNASAMPEENTSIAKALRVSSSSTMGNDNNASTVKLLTGNKKAAKASRRKANRVVKATIVAVTAMPRVNRYTGSLYTSDHDESLYASDDDDYHHWQCQEIMWSQRMKRILHAWRSGGLQIPRWSDPC